MLRLHPPPSLLAPSKKRSSSPRQVGKEDNTWKLIWKSLLICFESCQDIPCSHRQSNKKMVRTLLMVTPHVRDSLEDESILITPKKGLPRPWSLAKEKRYFGAHLKEELIDLFWALQGYSYFHKQRRKRVVNTLLMVSIIPICKR